MRSEEEIKNLLEKLEIILNNVGDEFVRKPKDFCMNCLKIATDECLNAESHYIVQTTELETWVDALKWVLGRFEFRR